jgi:16S rRNA (guanine(966)-N(2))-methyltransferase RsmD
VPGGGTRPITDRAKEALFSILAPGIPGCVFLDLFAGTGGVGIEALSRGGEWCDFVDRENKAVKTIHANLERTGLADRARVLRRDVFGFLSAAPEQPYDVIYVAPPQYKGLWSRTLLALDAADGWLSADGIVVAQIHPREYEAVALAQLAEYDSRNYGSVRLVFYRARPA